MVKLLSAFIDIQIFPRIIVVMSSCTRIQSGFRAMREVYALTFLSIYFYCQNTLFKSVFYHIDEKNLLGVDDDIYNKEKWQLLLPDGFFRTRYVLFVEQEVLILLLSQSSMAACSKVSITTSNHVAASNVVNDE